ncbi:MAG: phosphoglycerate kinase [Chloroflexi bacterium]|nr:phosphoglycerate kinase [Chloroflexota bacterium]MBT7082358.1 phosphoglycerate kinase [Chloroflexota bacterium]
MNKKTIRDIDVKDKKVLVRVDLNVPFDQITGDISDETRIRAILPTVNYLLENNAKIILCSHIGRPKGQVVDSMRLTPVAKRLSGLLKRPVTATTDCIGPDVVAATGNMVSGDIVLLENLRFHAEEEANDPDFAKALAALADVYVSDAFGTAHRAHASTAGVTKYIPSVAGFLIEKEISMLHNALDEPKRPLTAIVGGAKVSDKITLIDKMLEQVDNLLVGGGMVSTFLRALGHDTGASLVEPDKIDLARRLMDKAKANNTNLVLPSDLVVADKFDREANAATCQSDKIPADSMVMDIGPKSVSAYSDIITKSKTILWNGPMGVFEWDNFANGTTSIAKLLASLDAITIMGGGSTSEVVDSMGLADKMTHVSTGGGASLKLLEGSVLPGLAALMDKD